MWRSYRFLRSLHAFFPSPGIFVPGRGNFLGSLRRITGSLCRIQQDRRDRLEPPLRGMERREGLERIPIHRGRHWPTLQASTRTRPWHEKRRDRKSLARHDAAGGQALFRVRPPRKRESSIKNRYHPLVAILFCTFFSFCDVISGKKRIFAADMAKNVYIISGCNGAGKTTASYTVLPDILAKIQNYVK